MIKEMLSIVATLKEFWGITDFLEAWPPPHQVFWGGPARSHTSQSTPAAPPPPPADPMINDGITDPAMVANCYTFNNNGGALRNWVAWPLEDKVARVAGVYLDLLEADPTNVLVQEGTHVGKCFRGFAQKCINEIEGGNWSIWGWLVNITIMETGYVQFQKMMACFCWHSGRRIIGGLFMKLYLNDHWSRSVCFSFCVLQMV